MLSFLFVKIATVMLLRKAAWPLYVENKRDSTWFSMSVSFYQYRIYLNRQEEELFLIAVPVVGSDGILGDTGLAAVFLIVLALVKTDYLVAA